MSVYSIHHLHTVKIQRPDYNSQKGYSKNLSMKSMLQ